MRALRTLVTAVLATASKVAYDCTGGVCSCRTGTCPFLHNVTSTGEPFLFCLRSEPLSPFRLLGAGSRFFAFDEVTVTTHSNPVRIAAASDDTRFSDLFYSEAADARALAEAKSAGLPSLWSSSILYVFGGSGTRQSYVFSPHYDSCLAIRPSNSRRAEVEVQFKRRSLGDRDTSHAADGFKNRLASIAAGSLLLITAGYLARSTAFHYGAGMALSMLLGVAIVSLPSLGQMESVAEAHQAWSRDASTRGHADLPSHMQPSQTCVISIAPDLPRAAPSLLSSSALLAGSLHARQHASSCLTQSPHSTVACGVTAATGPTV